MFKKITVLLCTLSTYGYFYQSYTMDAQILTLKTGESITCKEIPAQQLTLEDLRILKDNFGQNIFIDLEGFQENLRANNKKCMCAQLISKEAPITIGVAIYRDTDEEGFANLLLIGTHLDYNKKGVGSHLIDSIITYTKCSALRAFAEKRALSFYDKLGFTREPQSQVVVKKI